jgi:beta-glucanase (GH16 family)
LLGFPDVSAVARSELRHAPVHAAALPDATHALLHRSAWRLIFRDDFGQATLDHAKWQPNWLGVSDRVVTPSDNRHDLNCAAPSQVSVAEGTLQLAATATRCATTGHIYRFASGLVNTRSSFRFTFGLVAARIYIPAGADHAPVNFPAFWAVGAGSGPDHGELDIMEALRGCRGLAWHFHGSAGAPGECVPLDHPAGWHVFAADWEPRHVTFYYDGQAVGEIERGITHGAMYLVLNNSVDPTYGAPSSAPATMSVDWVRVYQRTHARVSAR